jgi:hypothetical protein
MHRPVLIPANVLATLVEGSHEARVARVQRLVESKRAELFGAESESVRVTVGGTYTTHAILFSTHATKPVLRIEFVEAKGNLSLTKVETVSVPTYSGSTTEHYAKSELDRAVEDLLEGRTSAACARLTAALPLLPEPIAETTSPALVALREHFASKSKWRTLTSGANRASVLEFLQARTTPVLDIPKLRYQHRIDGVTPSEIRADILPLLRCVSALSSRVSEAKTALESRRAGVSQAAAGSLPVLDVLVSGLGSDLENVQRLVAESLHSLDNVQNLSQVYDVLAEALVTDYEISSAFATELVERLTRQ